MKNQPPASTAHREVRRAPAARPWPAPSTSPRTSPRRTSTAVPLASGPVAPGPARLDRPGARRLLPAQAPRRAAGGTRSGSLCASIGVLKGVRYGVHVDDASVSQATRELSSHPDTRVGLRLSDRTTLLTQGVIALDPPGGVRLEDKALARGRIGRELERHDLERAHAAGEGPSRPGNLAEGRRRWRGLGLRYEDTSRLVSTISRRIMRAPRRRGRANPSAPRTGPTRRRAEPRLRTEPLCRCTCRNPGQNERRARPTRPRACTTRARGG